MEIFRKQLAAIPGKTKHAVRLEGADTEFGSYECWADQVSIIRAISDTPEVLFCGSSRPHSIKMFHSGARWVVEAEAVIDEAPTVR